MLQAILSLLIAAGGVAFALLAVLAAAGLVDPMLAGAAFGVALLAAGADEVAGALVAGWVSRRPWQPSPGRPTVQAGRLTSVGFGLVLVSAGVVHIGIAWMPPPVQLAAVALFVVGFALGLVGGSCDRRRPDAARSDPRRRAHQ